MDQLFAGGDLEKNNGGVSSLRARLNYFGRAAYNYKEKYLLELLWRYDGSDIFPEETRYGFFPGVMAGWVISKENFMQSIPGSLYTFDACEDPLPGFDVGFAIYHSYKHLSFFS